MWRKIVSRSGVFRHCLDEVLKEAPVRLDVVRQDDAARPQERQEFPQVIEVAPLVGVEEGEVYRPLEGLDLLMCVAHDDLDDKGHVRSSKLTAFPGDAPRFAVR